MSGMGWIVPLHGQLRIETVATCRFGSEIPLNLRRIEDQRSALIAGSATDIFRCPDFRDFAVTGPISNAFV